VSTSLSLTEKAQELIARSSQQHREKDLEDDSDDQLEFRYYGGKYQKDSDRCLLAKSISLKIIIFQNSFSNPSNHNLPVSLSSNCQNSNSNVNIINNNNCNKIKQFEFVTFRINEIKATQLRKGMFFNPDPYVKITIMPNSFNFGTNDVSPPMSTTGSAQFSNGNLNSNPVLCQSRSSIPFGYVRDYKTKVIANTCFPNWKNEVVYYAIFLQNEFQRKQFNFFLKNFVIVAREHDKILIEVKDKFARTKPSINRFLGRILIDLSMLVEMARLNKG
jgi:hypothetical protein